MKTKSKGKLRSKHRRHLRASGLSAQTMAAARLRTVSDPAEAAKILGWAGSDGPVPALAIPVFDRTGRIVTIALRPDTPRKRQDGRAPKYEWPKGQKSRLYFPPEPLVQESAWGDKDSPLLVTEGVKKALAAAQFGYPAIAAPGVCMFHDMEAKRERGILKLHPDLDGIPLAGRKVFIAFDGGDTTENPNVVLAEARLARMLTNANAEVHLIRIPFSPGGQKVGLDDYLARKPDAKAALRKLVERKSQPADPLHMVQTGLDPVRWTV